MSEWIIYYEMYKADYPDHFAANQQESRYTKAQRDRACAECAYVLEHGALPEWASVIEQVKLIDDTYQFTWRDPDNLL